MNWVSAEIQAIQGMKYAELAGILKGGIKGVNGGPAMIRGNTSSIGLRIEASWRIRSFLWSDVRLTV